MKYKVTYYLEDIDSLNVIKTDIHKQRLYTLQSTVQLDEGSINSANHFARIIHKTLTGSSDLTTLGGQTVHQKKFIASLNGSKSYW